MKMADDAFQKFCGGPIFNTTLLLDKFSTWPQFTQCFQDSVLVWLPCGCLWLLLPFYLGYLIHYHEGVHIHINLLNTLKSFFCVLLALISIIELISAINEKNDEKKVFDVVFVAAGIKASTFIVVCCVIQIERMKGIITSGVLWIFWFLLLLAGIIPFYTQIMQKQSNGSLIQFALFYISYALVLVEFLLHSFAEKLNHDNYALVGENPSPELSASFLSCLTFWWMTSLILRAYRKDLEEDHLFDLHPRDKSSRLVPQFQKAWERELDRAKILNIKRERKASKQNLFVSLNDHAQASGEQEHVATETTSLLAGGGTRTKRIKSKQVGASLLRVLAKTYGLELLKSWACRLVFILLQFVSPMLLDALISFTKNKQNEASWMGYIFAFSLFVVAVTGSVFFHQQFHLGLSLGMRIKSACISAVYKKTLTMSNEARRDFTVGEIINLMSVDCERLDDMAGYLWMFWSAPLQITIALVLLWGQLGAAVLTGVTIMVLLIPLNAFLAVKSRRYQVQQMKLKDARIKLMNEVLTGMKVLKLYAWEQSFEDKVLEIRNQEIDILKKAAYVNIFSTFAWTCAPFLVTLATFATYILTSESHYLDAQKAFVSLSLFNILRVPINLLPVIISYLTQAHVSMGRLGKFLRNADIDDSHVQYNSDALSAVSIRNGSFTWNRELSVPTLKNINLNIPKGRLVAVVGQVGSGKTSLVSTILGEMERLEGYVVVQSSIAYVPQQAWIQNATLRDNILFGDEYREQQYNKVLDACALRADLSILPAGDLTEIGEKGINLSGGQKQRVSLARAIYNNADIYLLDDPLSAVDSHVGKHIFNEVISSNGILRHKTRVLVTHGVHWLPLVDTIVVMTDGHISEMGSYDQLLSHDGDFAQFLKTYLTQNESDDEDPEIKAMKAKILERVDSVTSDTVSAASEEDEQMLGKSRVTLKRPLQGQMPLKEEAALEGANKPEDGKLTIDKNKLIKDETSQKGQVKWSVLMTYFRAIGLVVTGLMLLMYAVFQGLSVYSSVWLSQWTDDGLLANTSLANTSAYKDRNYMYLGVYGGLGLGQAIVVLAYSLLAGTCMVTAAGHLHAKMLKNIMRSPMSFFDTTPSGRILNRFSSDVDVIDNTLPGTLRVALTQVFIVLSTLIVISYSTPIFMTVIIPLGFLYYLVQRFYIPSSRQLKRIESVTHSPIFNHFNETITGTVSIRAYKAQDRFVKEIMEKMDKHLVFYFAGIASNRWLGFHLELIGNLVVLAAALFAVATPDLNSGLVGLSVSYAMQVTVSLNWMVRYVSDLETNAVSVERLKEYSETPTEGEWSIPERRPPTQWPENGAMNFTNYSTHYRPGLDLVLKGLTCDIHGGEKIGIVGRTGAGKSSLTLALFRLIEAVSGSITIDNRIIGELGLHDLRSRITILPQDPFLFSGPLRMNLDPFDLYSDEQVWEALDHAHLKKFVAEAPGRLQYECGEGGASLSVGQRQLVCLARSLLRKTKILVLDEATAAVDMETDDLIQQTIRTEFKDCTVLTIAHRLNTILDYDRILVMDKGMIKEFDSPDKLLQDRETIFYGLAKDANLV